MARLANPGNGRPLADYLGVAHLAPAAESLRAEATPTVGQLKGRRVWMVSSTEQGGGVAEMLPGLLSLLRDLGVDARWVILESSEPAFFNLTKRLHNLIHGAGEPRFVEEDRTLYERINQENADEMAQWLAPGDVVIVHDPQPMAMAGLLRERVQVRTVWRCHIGLDESNEATRAAWSFLRPYGTAYDRGVFSAPEYIPPFLGGRSTVIVPGIDPLSDKNRELSPHELAAVLSNSAMASLPGPVVPPPFPRLAHRILPDGSAVPASLPEDIGLLGRPIVTQVSRWDRLKGFLPLLEAFADLKARIFDPGDRDPMRRRHLDLARLVLAGPEPGGVADDPEEGEVLEEIREAYRRMDPAVQDDVAILCLPHSGVMINALQRCSVVAVQNSLREGFGLTVSEAMWKRVPVLTNSQACGPRLQVRDRIDGRVIADPEDRDTLRQVLSEMIVDAEARRAWGREAQRRVHDRFLLLGQVRAWIDLLSELL